MRTIALARTALMLGITIGPISNMALVRISASGTALPPALLHSAAPPPTAVQNKDELIKKIVTALGGEQNLAAVKTVRITARIGFGTAPAEPLLVELKRPGMIREEVTIQGKVLIRGYNGVTGWQINPFENNSGPQALSPEETKAIAEEAVIDDPLVNYRARGNDVELAGTEPVDGHDAYKLKVTLKSGEVNYFFYDAGSYLKVKWQANRQIDGKDTVLESYFSDHRKVGNLMYPFLTKSGAKGEEVGQVITTEKVELNPSIDDARFSMPSSKGAI